MKRESNSLGLLILEAKPLVSTFAAFDCLECVTRIALHANTYLKQAPFSFRESSHADADLLRVYNVAGVSLWNRQRDNPSAFIWI